MENVNEALLLAAEVHSETAVKEIERLLQKGADPNFLNHEGANALHRCIERTQSVKVVNMLLKAGSSIQIKLTEPEYIMKMNKEYTGNEALKWNTTRTMLTKIDELTSYIKRKKIDKLGVLPYCDSILELFSERYEELLEEDQKIIQKYRLRKFFNMI